MKVAIARPVAFHSKSSRFLPMDTFSIPSVIQREREREREAMIASLLNMMAMLTKVCLTMKTGPPR